MTRMQRPVDQWTNRVLFGAMFLAAGAFAAPWKVTLVLACTFVSTLELLPRSPTRSKCIGWLLIAGLILWPVWILLPSNPDDYQPFQFVEERARLEQECAVLDDQNAAATYARLLETSEPNDRVLRAWIEESSKVVLRRPWKREEYPELARWLDEHRGMIEALKSLGAYSQCRFSTEPAIRMTESPDPRWKAVRTWAFMLTMAANRKAGEGDVAGALQLYALNLRMAHHHLQQLDTMDYLIGLAVENMVFRGITGLAIEGTPAPDELAAMDALIATPSHEWTSAWDRLRRFECLAVKNSLCRALYEINTKGRIRYSHSGCPDAQKSPSPYCKGVNGKIWASGLWVLLPRSPWKFVRRVDERYAQFARIGQPDAAPGSPGTKHRSRFRANHEYFLDRCTDILEPGYYKIHDTHLKSVATHRACRITLLLRQYKNETGHWPASLDEVAAQGGPELWTDPLNAGSFVYQLDGQAFRLYSKGLNGTDENGAGGDDLSFWPPRAQDTEREDAPPEPK